MMTITPNGQPLTTGMSEQDKMRALDEMFKSTGAGGFYNRAQTALVAFDRFHKTVFQGNAEHAGITFMTRPRLNLQSAALRQHRIMSTLDTTDAKSTAFMIRCLLDTVFARNVKTPGPLVDTNNPFITPITNLMTSLSGFPDPVMGTTTTEGGFFSEDQTFVTGWDELNKTYDLTLSTRDIQGGVLMKLFYYWFIGQFCVTRGIMPAYADDIDERRMNYTVSIYRFTLDPSRRYITGYAKATGCFPKSVPIGAKFNVNENELRVSASEKFSIPFTANKIEYEDPAILEDFNTLIKRYCQPMQVLDQSGWEKLILPTTAETNYTGLPYVKAHKGQNMLVWMDHGY